MVTILAIILRNRPNDLNNYWNGAMPKPTECIFVRIYVCRTRTI